MQQLMDNIYLIKVPLPGNPLKNLNAYYVKGRERNLLIDTGFNMQPCHEALQQGLTELKADMNRTDIFLTHLHSDHSGLAARMAAADTAIYLSKNDMKYLDRFYEPDYWQRRTQNQLALGFCEEELVQNSANNPLTSYAPEKNNNYCVVQDGQRIDLGDCRLTCLETPGHTPGHMCLFDEERKILFSGDHIIFDITPNITSWDGIDNSLGLYLASLEKIKKLDINITLSAHRSSMGSCHSRVDELLSHHQARLAEVYGIIKESPGLTAYQIASRMTWSIRAKDWPSFPVTQKWFAVREAAAHLDYFRCNGMIRRVLEGQTYNYYLTEPQN